jgi:hypothetical protein
LENTGLVGFRGQGGIEAMKMTQGIFSPSKTGLFTSLAMSGMIPKELMSQMNTATGSTTGFSTFDRYRIMQERTRGMGLPLFQSLANSSPFSGPMGGTIMGQAYGATNMDQWQKLYSKARSGAFSDEEFKKEFEEMFKDPTKTLGQNIQGLQDEMSAYYKAQIDLNGSMLALKTVIGVEVLTRSGGAALLDKFGIDMKPVSGFTNYKDMFLTKEQSGSAGSYFTGSRSNDLLLSKYFPGDDTMRRIMMAESGGDPTKHPRNKNGSIDRGLFQINSSSWDDKLMKAGIISSPEDLFDPETNFKAAAYVKKHQGYSAWDASKGKWGTVHNHIAINVGQGTSVVGGMIQLQTDGKMHVVDIPSSGNPQ